MKGLLRKLLLLCLLVVAGPSLYGEDWSISVKEIRCWCSPDRSRLNVELDLASNKNYCYDNTRISVKVKDSFNQKADPLASKNHKIHPDTLFRTYSIEMPLHKTLDGWKPSAPIIYHVEIDIKGELGDYTHTFVNYQQDLGIAGETELPEGLRVVMEDGAYAGYDGQLPTVEIDSRTRYIRSQGYLLVRDEKGFCSPRYARDCARLGMWLEPQMAPYTATNVQTQSYLQEVELRTKRLAFSPAILHWLLPPMPDSVAELCKRRIAAIDARPVLMADDRTLLAAEPALPEMSLKQPELQTDSLVEISPASLLKGAPGIEYVYRVNCGGGEVTDSNGQLWRADTLQTNLAQRTPNIINVGVGGELKQLAAADQEVMQSYRICVTADSMHYRFPADTLSSYCVELFFVEPLFKKSGGRVFSVMIDGLQTDPFDLRIVTGGQNVGSKMAFSVIPRTQPVIDICFPKPYAGHPLISAIAVGKVSPKRDE